LRHGLLCILGLFAFAVCTCFAPDVIASCITSQCHSALGKIPRPHAPVSSGECQQCHSQTSTKHPSENPRHDFRLKKQGAGLCYQCHEPFGGGIIHAPVSEGDCISCHNPHGSKGAFLLDNPEDLWGLCGQCHDEPSGTAAVIHGPAASGACSTCHAPHVSPNRFLLKRRGSQICYACHKEFEKGLESAPVVHTPVKQQECGSCHDAHESAHKALLISALPEACFECHDDMRKYKRAKVKHPAALKDNSCANCHFTHYSNNENLLVKKEMDLCLECHSKENTRKSKPLKNIKKEIEGKEYLHGPLKSKRCAGCHDPHGSEYARLLNASYPAGFYARYEKGLYDFCLQCHEKNLLRFPDTTVYTNFRNGKLNLHYVHVVRPKKGRTCRTCHTPHASNNPKLIDNYIPFGDWQIPIRFMKTSSGGSCSPGCHRPYRYDRIKPEQYR